MALANYSDLLSAVGVWTARSDLAGSAADFITLADARLNRELGAVETDATLTGTQDSRTIDISAHSVVMPIALFLQETEQDDGEIMPQAAGTFPYLNTSGRPTMYSIDGTNIKFDRELDEAYSFRFRFRQRFALSESVTTNWLLENHPDVYLAAVLVWSGLYRRDAEFGGNYKQVLEEGLREVKHIIAQSKRGTLVPDPALSRIGRRSWDWINQ